MAGISGVFNLFLKAEEASPLSGEALDLFTFGSSPGISGGLFSAVNLFLGSGSNVLSGQLNFFLPCLGPEPANAALNLYLTSSADFLSNSISLYVGSTGISSSLSLFVKGSGITAGGFPLGAGMNLFIGRAEANVINLFLQGPGSVLNSGVDLFTMGAFSISSGINLSLPSVKGLLTNTVKLYSHGF